MPFDKASYSSSKSTTINLKNTKDSFSSKWRRAQCKEMKYSVQNTTIVCILSSCNEVFSKILKKPSIVQKWMIPHMKAFRYFIDTKQFFFEKPNNQKQKAKKCHFSAPPTVGE